MPPIRPELLDELLRDYKKPDDLLGQDGLLQQLTKALVERALDGELTHHLGYEKHDPAGDNSGNSRNGTSPKTLRGKRGQVQIDVPRDRAAEFEPQLVKKNQTRFDGLDENIISLYARGMTQREIQGHLEEIYGVEVSPSLISTVTDSVMDEVRAWQSRPLDSVYPILYLDALQVKVKSQGRVTNKAIYLAFGVNMQGLKEVLGMWASENEGAKFWMQIVTELKNRGVSDIFIACVDGLKGFPEAIEAVYPQTQVQLCMVHMVRHALSYVSHRDRKAVATDLKLIYQAATLAEAEGHLARFEETWAGSYPVIARSWKTNWSRVVPMFGYPSEIRRAIYTTNTIESLNMTLRKITKNRSLFPSDEAVFKLMYLALRNISKRWTMPIKNWSGALNQFAILFEGRVSMGGLTPNSLTQNAA
ncbi:MAG TPA: IS256 family transposase [Pyrinomonadaceae bacterium]|jgi:putative transposase|nr:IS256 family transposase [Pyrinomonadaceae bacterium]